MDSLLLWVKSYPKGEVESKASDKNKHGNAGGVCNNVRLEKDAKAEAALWMVGICVAIK